MDKNMIRVLSGKKKNKLKQYAFVFCCVLRVGGRLWPTWAKVLYAGQPGLFLFSHSITVSWREQFRYKSKTISIELWLEMKWNENRSNTISSCCFLLLLLLNTRNNRGLFAEADKSHLQDVEHELWPAQAQRAHHADLVLQSIGLLHFGRIDNNNNNKNRHLNFLNQ